ncbi:MAG: ABC transporter ATP-binding protein [Clostridiales bacterium]|nr:ABC transporter ATP-binding protein [Clostridiales bacterium]
MLKIEDLKITINDNHIIKGISFEAGPGEIVGLVGESGSGKTITSLAVAGLLPENFHIQGEIHKGDDSSKGTKVGFIFQEPMTALNPLMKVGRQIEEVLKINTKIGSKERKERVIKMMEQVQLENVEEVYNKYPYELSGGMRQRVVIAIATILKPSIIIADEPTTALDVDTSQAILEIILDINKKVKSTILFISHDLSVISKICSRVIVMKDGRIIEEGSTRDILNNPKHDYTKKLISAANLETKVEVATAGENILDIRDVTLYHFDKHKKEDISGNINFSIRRGEILGLLGKSGCGKSSLSRAIAGLSGLYNGNIIKKCSNIQMIFQDPYGSLNPSKTIGFILSEPLRNKGISKAEIKDKVIKTLLEVELSPDYYNRYPDMLSGGQRQRVSIGAAVISEPDLLIADEPVSALDVTIRSQILELILKMQQKHGMSVLMISHDVMVLNNTCDRIIKWEEFIK